MSFFEMYNAAPAVVKPSYRKNSELPLFVPLKIVDLNPATTFIGPTHQVNAWHQNSEIFFYLNAADHEKIVKLNGVVAVKEMIALQQNPFAVAVRKRTSLGALILPSSNELIEQYQNNEMIRKSQIPAGMLSEFNFEALAEMNICLNE